MWRGSNPAAKRVNKTLRLYLSAWENPYPDKKVLSISYTSAMTEAAPFCVAMTVEDAGPMVQLLGKKVELHGKRMDGTKFDWAAYRGKIVLVDFWASWRRSWQDRLPNMRKAHDLYHERGFEIVGISMDSSRQALERALAHEKLPWITLHDTGPGGNHPLAEQYGLTGRSTALLIDREGKVVSVGAHGRELKNLLLELIGPAYVPKGKLTYIDLQSKANQKLTETLDGGQDNSLSELLLDGNVFGGVEFRIVDALMYLARGPGRDRPTEINGIPVNKTFKRLYLLHAAARSPTATNGTTIARYQLNYEDGHTAPVDIVYGEDLRDWWTIDDGSPLTRGTLVWRGSNPSAQRAGRALRLYVTMRTNPHPD